MKKLLALILALMLVCLAFVGCQEKKNDDDDDDDDGENEVTTASKQYSDSIPMEVSNVNKFINEKNETVAKDFESWSGFEISMAQEYTMDSEKQIVDMLIRYNIESETIYIEADLGMMSMKAYAKDNVFYYDEISVAQEMGAPITMSKIKASADGLGIDMEDMFDVDSMIGEDGSSLFSIIESLTAEKLGELGVKVFVTKNDRNGESYRMVLTEEYLEYVAEEVPGAADMLLSDLDMGVDNVTLSQYEMTYDFAANGKLAGAKVIADMTVSVSDGTETTTTNTKINMELSEYSGAITFNPNEYNDFNMYT